MKKSLQFVAGFGAVAGQKADMCAGMGLTSLQSTRRAISATDPEVYRT